MAVNWNILAQPQPEATPFNPLAAVQARRQGEQDHRVDRKDNALLAAGRSMAAGDSKGAQAALYGAGEFDAGFKIQEHQLKQAQHEMDTWQRVGKLAENATPEQWGQTLAMYRRMGINLPAEYLDPAKGQQLAKAHAYDRAARLQQAVAESQIALNRSHAGLFSAQAELTRQKPPEAPIKLGYGESLYQRGPGGTYSQIVQGRPKAPPGFEPDPARPGFMRPIPGGPGDDVKGEQAARVALLTQTRASFPELRRIDLGDDKTPPVVPPPGSGIAGVGGMVSGLAQHHGGFGDAAQGYRLVTTGTEAILRALTGAAATESEVKRVAEKYMPLPLDSLQTRQQKLKLFEETVDLMGGLISKGIVGADVQEAFKSGNIDDLRARVSQRPQVPGVTTAPMPPVTSRPPPPPGFEYVK